MIHTNSAGTESKEMNFTEPGRKGRWGQPGGSNGSWDQVFQEQEGMRGHCSYGSSSSAVSWLGWRKGQELKLDSQARSTVGKPGSVAEKCRFLSWKELRAIGGFCKGISINCFSKKIHLAREEREQRLGRWQGKQGGRPVERLNNPNENYYKSELKQAVCLLWKE